MPGLFDRAPLFPVERPGDRPNPSPAPSRPPLVSWDEQRRQAFLAAVDPVLGFKAEVMARDTPSLVKRDGGVEYVPSETAAEIVRRCDEVVGDLRALFFDDFR